MTSNVFRGAPCVWIFPGLSYCEAIGKAGIPTLSERRESLIGLTFNWETETNPPKKFQDGSLITETQIDAILLRLLPPFVLPAIHCQFHIVSFFSACKKNPSFELLTSIGRTWLFVVSHLHLSFLCLVACKHALRTSYSEICFRIARGGGDEREESLQWYFNDLSIYV